MLLHPVPTALSTWKQAARAAPCSPHAAQCPGFPRARLHPSSLLQPLGTGAASTLRCPHAQGTEGRAVPRSPSVTWPCPWLQYPVFFAGPVACPSLCTSLPGVWSESVASRLGKEVSSVHSWSLPRCRTRLRGCAQLPPVPGRPGDASNEVQEQSWTPSKRACSLPAEKSPLDTARHVRTDHFSRGLCFSAVLFCMRNISRPAQGLEPSTALAAPGSLAGSCWGWRTFAPSIFVVGALGSAPLSQGHGPCHPSALLGFVVPRWTVQDDPKAPGLLPAALSVRICCPPRPWHPAWGRCSLDGRCELSKRGHECPGGPWPGREACGRRGSTGTLVSNRFSATRPWWHRRGMAPSTPWGSAWCGQQVAAGASSFTEGQMPG